MATASLGVRERMAAASKRIARVKLVDRAATGVITFGGVFIILSVLVHLRLHLRRGAAALPRRQGRAPGRAVARRAAARAPPPVAPLAVGVDEYQRYLYDVTPDGRVVFFRLPDGARQRELPVPGLEGARVTAASRSLQGDLVAAGTADGRVALVQVRFQPVVRGPGARRTSSSRSATAACSQSTPRSAPVRDVSYEESAEGAKLVAALVADDEIALARVGVPADDGTDARPGARDACARSRGTRSPACGSAAPAALVATTASGLLYHWDVSGGTRTAHGRDAGRPGSADRGRVGARRQHRDRGRRQGRRVRLVPRAAAARGRPRAGEGARRSSRRAAPILSIASSTRERSFVTTGQDGSLSLRHLTSERTLLRFPPTAGRPTSALITPRADGILVEARGRHARALLARQPAPRVLLARAVRQGLVRGLRAARVRLAVDRRHRRLRAEAEPGPAGLRHDQGARFYALVFAIPLAVMGALYTSQFVHPTIKAKVKPTVEIMAALPSVVIGFIAGLWLASRVEAQPRAGAAPDARAPAALRHGGRPLLGSAAARACAGACGRAWRCCVILPLLLVGGVLAFQVGPWVEAGLFGGDVRSTGCTARSASSTTSATASSSASRWASR